MTLVPTRKALCFDCNTPANYSLPHLSCPFFCLVPSGEIQFYLLPVLWAWLCERGVSWGAWCVLGGVSGEKHCKISIPFPLWDQPELVSAGSPNYSKFPLPVRQNLLLPAGFHPCKDGLWPGRKINMFYLLIFFSRLLPRMKSSVPALLIVCLGMSLNSDTQQAPSCPPRPAPENITEFICNSPSLHEFPTGFPRWAKMISVEFTQVSSLGVEALQGLPNLQELHLSNNQLKTLPGGLFRNLPELHTLDLSTNLLEDLPPEIFTGVINLTHLSVSENQLAELRPSWFETLQELRMLSLDHNQLKEVPISCFDKLKELSFLDLSSNRLHRLSPDMFSGLDNLERLILESNPIRCIAPRSFHWRPKLSVISLRNCSLTEIIGAVQPLERLELLDLSNNELTMLHPPVAFPSANLSLDISGNPWACDCRMDNLLTWVKDHKIHLISKQEVLCAFPKSFKGAEATSLNRSQICPC